MSQDPAPLSPGRATPVAADQWADFPFADPAPRRRQGRWPGRRTPRPQVVSEAPLSRVLSLIEPVILMAFGALLGLMDQTATETSGWLRVPALVAALLIVAQAISDFQARRQAWLTPAPAGLSQAAEPSPSAGRVVAVVEAVDSGEAPGRAIHRATPVAVRVSPVAAAARDNPRVIYFVMGLSVWLALATLANPTAPWPLLVLSLLAAFLLFAEAWQMLRSRR